MAVYVRESRTSVITMPSDYRGDPSEFAMIVPMPKVQDRRQVTTVVLEKPVAVATGGSDRNQRRGGARWG